MQAGWKLLNLELFRMSEKEVFIRDSVNLITEHSFSQRIQVTQAARDKMGGRGGTYKNQTECCFFSH